MERPTRTGAGEAPAEGAVEAGPAEGAAGEALVAAAEGAAVGDPAAEVAGARTAVPRAAGTSGVRPFLLCSSCDLPRSPPSIIPLTDYLFLGPCGAILCPRYVMPVRVPQSPLPPCLAAFCPLFL